jgi:hypothetical protein
MIGEMLVWGFFSALGWMSATYTVEKILPDRPTKEEQVCSAWNEEKQLDGTIHRTRTCESKIKTSL